MSYESNKLEKSVKGNGNDTNGFENNPSKTPKRSVTSIVMEIVFVLISCCILYGIYLRHSAPDYQGPFKFYNFIHFAIFFGVIFAIQCFFSRLKNKK